MLEVDQIWGKQFLISIRKGCFDLNFIVNDINMRRDSVGTLSDGRETQQKSVGPCPTEFSDKFIPWRSRPTECARYILALKSA